MGYDPDMGARPLRRVIQQKVEDRLSDAVLAGQFEHGETVIVDVEVREDETEIILRSQDEDDGETSSEELMAAA